MRASGRRGGSLATCARARVADVRAQWRVGAGASTAASASAFWDESQRRRALPYPRDGVPPCRRGDLVAIYAAGAYGMTMASRYNAMPFPAEVMVDGDHATIIRRRESWEDLVDHERS